MSSLLEVVFENIVKHDVIQLLMLLVTNSKKIINVQCSEDITLIDNNEINTNALNLILNFNSDISVLINLQDMKADNIVLPIVLLRLVKYNNQYDIDFNFDFNDIKNKNVISLMKELHSYAKKIASKYNMASFFGGIEPALDEDTRYFTNENFIPLER